MLLVIFERTVDIVVFSSKEAATYDGVMPMIFDQKQRDTKTDHSLDPRIAVLVLNTKEHAMHDGVMPMIFDHMQRDPNSNHSLDPGIVVLVVLIIKEAALYDGFMPTSWCELEATRSKSDRSLDKVV